METSTKNGGPHTTPLLVEISTNTERWTASTFQYWWEPPPIKVEQIHRFEGGIFTLTNGGIIHQF